MRGTDQLPGEPDGAHRVEDDGVERGVDAGHSSSKCGGRSVRVAANGENRQNPQSEEKKQVLGKARGRPKGLSTLFLT